MQIQTQYSYEKSWRITKEEELLRIIIQEVGDADPQGTLSYIREVIKNGKVITVGSCRFRCMEETNNLFVKKQISQD